MPLTDALAVNRNFHGLSLGAPEGELCTCGHDGTEWRRAVIGDILRSETTAKDILYSGGRVPSSGFSDWPARQKKQRKKGRTLKFFLHRLKLQAGTCDDDHHTESQVIRAVTRPRPTTACSGQSALRKKAGVKREETGTHTGVCVLIFIGSASL
jgi:hypothetical protein